MTSFTTAFQFPVILTYSLLSFFSPPQTYVYRNNVGSYQGRAIQQGSKTTFYNKSGSYQGYSQKIGNSQNYYNRSGTYQGRITPQKGK